MLGSGRHLACSQPTGVGKRLTGGMLEALWFRRGGNLNRSDTRRGIVDVWIYTPECISPGSGQTRLQLQRNMPEEPHDSPEGVRSTSGRGVIVRTKMNYITSLLAAGATAVAIAGAPSA